MVPGKEKVASKHVTGQYMGFQNWLLKKKEGLKFGYRKKLGLQKWLREKNSVTIFGTQFVSVTIFETKIYFRNNIRDPNLFL